MSKDRPNFVSCHCHIASLDTASTPDAFVERELELGSGALVCTDHGTLAANRKVYDLAKANKIIPVLGLEGYLRDDNCPILTAAGYPKNERGAFTTAPKYLHVTIHFMDQAAYECGVRLLSKADERLEEHLAMMEVDDRKHGSERKPLFSWNDLEELGGYNTTMTTGCMIGVVQRHLMDNNDPAVAKAYFEKMKSIVKPGNLYTELNPHDTSKNWVEGIFLTMADGSKQRFYKDKVLLTDVGEITAVGLARNWAIGKHKILKSIKDRTKWREMPEQAIVDVQHIEDYLPNECRPWAPNGDLQAGLNRFMKILAKQYGAKILIGDDAHYATPDEKVVQDVRLSQGGSWRFYGCFEKRMPIDMADGSSKPIGKIRVGDMVKTYDFNTQLVTVAPVTAVFPTPATRESFVTNEFLRYGGRGQRRAIISTPIHGFWTQNGWEEVGTLDVPVGIRAPKPTSALIEVFEGAMLGDASISMAGRGSDIPYFAYGHAEDQMILTEMMAGYFNSAAPKRQSRERPRQDFFTTNSAHPFFKEEHRRWYVDGIKRVPRDLRLTPRMLAWWFMDDGSVCHGRPRRSTSGGTRSHTTQARFYTNGFPESDVEFLIGELKRFGLKARKYNYKTGWFITLAKTQWQKLSRIIERYVPEQLSYKLAEAGKTYIADSEVGFDGESVYCVAIKRERALPTGSPSIDTSVKYDFEVAGHHCFFVDGLLVHNSYHRKSSEEAFEHFSHTLGTKEPEFEEWIGNTHEWADRFKGFVFNTPVSIPTKFYEPEYALQPWFKGEDKDNSVKYTMYLIKKHGRMDWTNKVWIDRLRAEINLLHSNGVVDLLPYFFLDEEVCALYEKNRLLTGPGRGSAAGLLLTYLLDITHVDPIKYNLSMDRFLTMDRIKSGRLPDIDQDLSDRDLLLNPETGWLKARFGDHVAQISVDTKLKVASAAKDVARTSHQRCDTCAKIYPTASVCCGRSTRGFVPPEIEAWTKKFMKPPQGMNDFDFVMGQDTDEGRIQGSVEYDPALQDYIHSNPADWEIVKKCLGLTRQKSIHPCGFLIANRPISEFVPLTTISDVRVTSYTAESVEAVGGLKMDFLTVNALMDIDRCIKMIQQRNMDFVYEETYIDGKRVPPHRLVPFAGKLYDIWDLPEDQAVFTDVSTGNTETVFQFDTPGAKQWLEQFDYKKENGNYPIDSIEAMAAFTALDRKGPLDVRITHPDNGSKHNMLVEYARRARGETGSTDVLPVFDLLLPETYGIMCFQEQLQKMYQNLTGCSGPVAEEFRGLVAKKKTDKIQKLYIPFIEAASKTIGEDKAKDLWVGFQKWSGYGFNKSHAVCYSFTAYACAWLKHWYPLEWWTAVLGNAKKTEVAEKFWRHCGHLVDLPDVMLSGPKFEIQGERIRAPISLLSGIGDVAHNQILKYAPYTNIDDFCQKIEKHRVDTGTNVQKMKKEKIKETKHRDETTKKWIYDEREVEVTVFKKGYSALNRGVVKTLILSGAMDSLFPPEMHAGEQMVEFERALAAASGAKKPAKVDPKDWDFDSIQRYQTRKAILPVYGADLVEMFQRMQVVPDLNIDQISGKPTFSYVSGHNGRWNTVGVVGIKTLEECMSSDMGAEQSITLAVAAHIDDARVFGYGEERREACELMLDVDGSKVKFVRWAGSKIDLTPEYKQPLKGAVAMVVLNRYQSGRPFAVDGLLVVRPPLSEVAEEETKEEGEPNAKPNDSDSTE